MTYPVRERVKELPRYQLKLYRSYFPQPPFDSDIRSALGSCSERNSVGEIRGLFNTSTVQRQEEMRRDVLAGLQSA